MTLNNVPAGSGTFLSHAQELKDDYKRCVNDFLNMDLGL